LDFSFLSSLKKLKSLSINVEGKKNINLNDLINLENLVINWRNGKIVGLEKCEKIKRLCIIEYSEPDFVPISELQSLSELNIKTASVKTTHGLENLKFLEAISFGNCKQLQSVASINGNTKIKELFFRSCPKIEDYDELSNLTGIEKLYLVDCKKVKSIGFIKNYGALKEFLVAGNTDIVDGDLTPAIEVPLAYCVHRKHYNVKIDSKDAIAVRKKNIKKMKELFKKNKN